eukprot:scaffold163967_cov54-Attheya_sp.AAC.1
MNGRVTNPQTDTHQTQLGLVKDTIISFDGQIMTPPHNNSIFVPDNGDYGRITLAILSELGISKMDSFLDPHYWNPDSMVMTDLDKCPKYFSHHSRSSNNSYFCYGS